MNKVWTVYADRVKSILEKRGMSQRELAEKIGKTEVTVSRYMYAQRTPDANTILATSKALHVSCDYLLGLSDAENQLSEHIIRVVDRREEMETINVMLDEGAITPTRAYVSDAGIDIYSPERKWIFAHNSVEIDTGVHVEIPHGYVGMLKSKSGLNVKHAITGEGVIDAGYTGSIVAKLYNNSNRNYLIGAGDKIIQLVILPIETPEIKIVDKFGKTERGENGFGSTGR